MGSMIVGGGGPDVNGGNGNGDKGLADACGCSVETVRKYGGFAAQRYASGHLNSGYAQCSIDRIMLLVAKGECSLERIQCRTPITLRETDLDAAETITHTITPVGLIVVREIQAEAFVPGTLSDLNDYSQNVVVTSITAAGREALVDAATSTGTGQQARGFTLNAYNKGWHNYAAPAGIWADASTPLNVTVTNVGGTADAAYTINLFYDIARLG